LVIYQESLRDEQLTKYKILEEAMYDVRNGTVYSSEDVRIVANVTFRHISKVWHWALFTLYITVVLDKNLYL